MAMILATLLLNKLNKLKLTGLNPNTDGLEGGVTTRGSYDGLLGDIGVDVEGAPYDEEGGLWEMIDDPYDDWGSLNGDQPDAEGL